MRAGCVRRQAEVVAHQLSHTPQVDSIFNVPAGKDNICSKWHTHSRLANVISDYRSAFPSFLIGNQIAEYLRLSASGVRADSKHRSASSERAEPLQATDPCSLRKTTLAVRNARRASAMRMATSLTMALMRWMPTPQPRTSRSRCTDSGTAGTV